MGHCSSAWSADGDGVVDAADDYTPLAESNRLRCSDHRTPRLSCPSNGMDSGSSWLWFD